MRPAASSPRHAVAVVAVASWLAVLAGCGGGADLDDADPATLVAAGRQLYERHGCAECHGPRGHGDGRLAESLQPPPRDFRHPGNFRHGYDVEGIAATIRDGVAYDRRVMPSYQHLRAGERRALALFVRSIAADTAATTGDGGAP